MRAGWTKLGGAWREAWRGRGDNPLLKRWRLEAQRQQAKKPWWRRSPGLMLLCAMLSAGATYILALLLRDFFTVQNSAVGSRAFMLGLLKSGAAVVAWAGLAMGLVWLLARVYTVAVFALALLGQGRAKDGALRDEALISSAISDEQVVLAAVLCAWRLVTAPVLALSACAAVVYGLALMEPGLAEVQAVATNAGAQSGPIPAAQWWLALLLATLYLVVTVVGAYTGAACLALLLAVLGRGMGPLAPSLGAAQIILWHAWLAIATVAASASGGGKPIQQIHDWAVVGTAVLLAATLVWLAHCLRPARAIAAYAPLLAVLLAFSIAVLTGGPEPGALQGGAIIVPYAYAFLTFIAVAIPIMNGFHLGTALAQGAAAISAVPGYLFACCLCILAQCLLMFVFALLARAAVRRYRGGQL